MNRGLWTGLLTLILTGNSVAQTNEYPIISINSADRFLVDVISELEPKYDIVFLFNTQGASSVKISKNFTDTRLDIFLNSVFPEHTSYIITSSNQVLIFDHELPKVHHSKKEFRGKYYQFEDEWELKGTTASEITITGKIKARKSGDALLGVTVMLGDGMYGTSTNANGEFDIKVPAGYYTLKMEYLGYEPIYTPVEIRTNSYLDIALSESMIVLESIMISSEPENINITSPEIGLSKLNINLISLMPAFMGEVDVIKSLLMLPGVSTVGEGAGGFNVRGGGVDQNLILMDDIILFNPSHLFGFYSVYNPDFVRDVKLYKGSLHPSYGGRISSVLDVTLKEAQTEKVKVQGGIGMIASRFNLEIPLIKKKNGLLIGGRYAYPDWLLHSTKDLQLRSSNANFYDGTFKYTHAVGQNTTLSLTGYHSYDEFSLASDTTFAWTNSSLALKVDQSWNKLSGSFGLIYSHYLNKVLDDNQHGFLLDSFIDYGSFKVDFTLPIGLRHQISFGGTIISYAINQGNFQPRELNPENPFRMQDDKAIETGLYLADEYRVNNRLSFVYGLRLSGWCNTGPDDVFIYSTELPKTEETIFDTLHYDDDPIVTYHGVEPRLAFNYRFSDSNSFKFGYHRSYQYLHLLSNTTAITPTDQWQISNYHIKPMIGDQVSIGYFQNLSDNTYKLSVEGYYKHTQGQLDYKGGAEVLLNELIETDVLVGDGRSYGVELLAKKAKGRFNGWVGYTYSRSMIRVKGEHEEETINDGEYYPTNYDKPHDLSSFFSYKIEDHVSLGINFTYSTGRPVTIPTSKYQVENFLAVIQYSGRNQFRIPNYHRLDLSLTIDNIHHREKYQGSWVITIFNVYARKNAYSIFFNQYGFTKKLSVLGTMFPSLTYNFKFL